MGDFIGPWAALPKKILDRVKKKSVSQVPDLPFGFSLHLRVWKTETLKKGTVFGYVHNLT